MALAFFDLDGTLTKFDTFIFYCLLALLYRPWRVFALRPLFRACMNSYKGNMHRQELKEGFITAFLDNAEKDDVERWNKVFLGFILPLNLMALSEIILCLWCVWCGDSQSVLIR